MSILKIIGAIPARYESKRFPGKVLADLRGKTILQHVYENAVKSGLLNKVIIVTDNDVIRNTAERFNAEVVMTGKDCFCGTDRIAEAVEDIDCDIVINIQADQPVFSHTILDELITPMLSVNEIVVVTPIYPLGSQEEINNPNIVKVIIDNNGYALYFSRSPIPYRRDAVREPCCYKHIGIYAFRKDFLMQYNRFSPGILERIEGLEQLRILENGFRIKTVLAGSNSISIDTEEDLRLLNLRSTAVV